MEIRNVWLDSLFVMEGYSLWKFEDAGISEDLRKNFIYPGPKTQRYAPVFRSFCSKPH